MSHPQSKSNSRDSSSNHSWISDPMDPTQKGKFLLFPKTDVRFHSQSSSRGELKLAVHNSVDDPSIRKECKHLKKMNMPTLSEFPEDMDAQDPIFSKRQPCLCFPPHHVKKSNYIPHATITEEIARRNLKWGNSLSSRGKVSYLHKFWDWSVWIHSLLLKKNLKDLALAVFAASLEYSRPNSMYRALCEVWCPETNTFVTGRGEIGISLWALREVTGLSILGDYYEEVVPSFEELTNKSLPRTCLYLFKAFSIIAQKKDNDRIKHSDWIDFWFVEEGCCPNPSQNSIYKKAMKQPRYKEGKLQQKCKVNRPLFPLRVKNFGPNVPRNQDHFTSLGFDFSPKEKEELEIAAYLSLWLCRYALPSGDDHLRVGTFKVASRMASGVTYSLIPPILASIYKGLSQTRLTCAGKRELGLASYSFPSHFLFAWAGHHFIRGLYAEVDADIGRPTIRRFAGVMNAFHPWEVDHVDARTLIRGSMNPKEFCWNPIPPPSSPGLRKDDGERSLDTLEFMVSIRPGVLTFRRGNSYTLEMYNPHRFTRQQGFLQRLPGSPIQLDLQSSPACLYSYWLSLTRTKSGVKFHIPGPCKDMFPQHELNFHDWWTHEVVSHLDTIPASILTASEFPEFELRNAPLEKSKVRAKGQSNQNPERSVADHSGKSNPDKARGTNQNCDSGEKEQIPEPGRKRRRLIKSSTKKPSRSEDPQNNPNPDLEDSFSVAENFSSPNQFKDFPSIPQEMDQIMHLTPSKLGNKGGEMIDALLDSDDDCEINPPSGDLPIDIGGGVLTSPVTREEEDEVDSEVVRANNPHNREEICITSTHVHGNTFQLPGPSILPQLSGPSNLPQLPVQSFVTHPPVGLLDSASILQSVLHDAMIQYLKKEFEQALGGGFSQVRSWWTSRRSHILNSILSNFHTDPSLLVGTMENFLREVDFYLSKRKENLESTSAEKRKEELANLSDQISVRELTSTHLNKKLSKILEEIRNLEEQKAKLISQADIIQDELEKSNEDLGELKEKHSKLEKAPVQSATDVDAINQMRQNLEKNMKNIANGNWSKTLS